jgi:hypothetical protein
MKPTPLKASNATEGFHAEVMSGAVGGAGLDLYCAKCDLDQSIVVKWSSAVPCICPDCESEMVVATDRDVMKQMRSVYEL